MPTPINISLDTSRYKVPTKEDIQKAKQFILQRLEVARIARQLAGDAIMDAAEHLVEIAYRYKIPPQQLSFDSTVNEDMMREITAVMDQLEEEILSILEEYALSCTDDAEEQRRLLILLGNLGHRGMSLRETTHAYLWRFLHQTCALSAAFLFSSIPLSQARTRIRTAIRSVRTTPEIGAVSRYRHLFASPYIQSGGIVTYPDGTPNPQGVPADGYNAIMQIYNIAIAQIWQKYQLDIWKEESEGQTAGTSGEVPGDGMDEDIAESRIVGYYQLRGSDYPCHACDSAVGFYPIGQIEDVNNYLVHPNCCCYRVPIYSNGKAGRPLTSE